jgi:ADP-ribose pyrophosphatase
MLLIVMTVEAGDRWYSPGHEMAWKKLRETDEATGFRRSFARYYQLPNGKEKGFDITEVGETVSVLAFTAAGEVILVEQFRPGPEKTLLEPPGGLVDPGEEPIVAAQRELLEETGYAPWGHLHYVSSIYLGAYVEGVKHFYVALLCQKVAEPNFDEGEFATTRLMPLDEFRRWLRSSQAVETGGLYQALDFLEEL